MIFHKLVLRFLVHGDDEYFYRIQAKDTVKWLRQAGVELTAGTEVLDLGAGLGLIGGELNRAGCSVTFADEHDQRLPFYSDYQFKEVNIDSCDFSTLGRYDLVICSNVLEHLARPDRLLARAQEMLKPEGYLYLCWSNWLSPWGGHEFSPFHYLGPRAGPRIYDRLMSKPRKHTPYSNVFPTFIGRTLRKVKSNEELRIIRLAPRYYPELAFIARIPILREFLTWNCAILLQRRRG